MSSILLHSYSYKNYYKFIICNLYIRWLFIPGIPHPRVHLINGVPENGRLDTCTAGAGSLLLELGTISRLLGDPVYESLARRAVRSLWVIRNNQTGLLGNTMNVHSGEWISNMSGLGIVIESPRCSEGQGWLHKIFGILTLGKSRGHLNNKISFPDNFENF